MLVFNGEIFNHGELRRDLEARGHRFRTSCDTEVVLRAFLEWDVDCLPKMRGMFAFAIWSERECRLLLARDRMGIKPLYVARRHRDIFFGSELKALFAHRDLPRELDGQALHDFTSLNYVPAPRTLVTGIEKLLPGRWLEWRDGRVRTAAYWQLSFEPDSSVTADSASEELDSLLRSAVRENLASDVPTAIWLSGGLDSTTVLHYAAEASTAPLRTFSVSFPGRSFDDGGFARRAAAHYGAEHTELDIHAGLDLPGAIGELVYYGDEPGADAGALPVWFLSQLTSCDAKVALSGEGADELFGGYATYLADRYARRLQNVPPAIRRAAYRLAQSLPASDEKIGLDYKLQRMLGGSLLPPDEAHFYWNGAFSQTEKHALYAQNGFPPVGRLARSLPWHAGKVGYLNRYLWLDQVHYLPDNILYKCDRMSMAHGLEVRPPFLDHRIVEFAARLPEALKIRGNRLKSVLRRTVEGKLPAEVLRRRKEGLDIPVHEWLRGPLRPLLLDTLNRRSIEETGLFAWPAVERTLRRHLDRRVNLGYHLWGLLILLLWMRRWGVHNACDPAANPENLALSALNS